MGRIQNADVKSLAELTGLGSSQVELLNTDKMYSPKIVSVLETILRKNNATTVDPTITNDSSQNYEVGSWWINTVTKSSFICTSNGVGTAVWKMQTNNDIPLSMSSSTTPDAKLNFLSSSLSQSDGGNAVVGPVSKIVYPSLTTPFINFQTQALSSASHFEIVWPSPNNIGQFRRVGFALSPVGKIKVTFSAEAASVGALANAGTVLATSCLPIGYIDLVCTSGSGFFKTASSVTSIIENTNIYRFLQSFLDTPTDQYYTATGGQTIFTPTLLFNASSQIDVLRNGVEQQEGVSADYQRDAVLNQIIFNSGVTVNAVIKIRVW